MDNYGTFIVQWVAANTRQQLKWKFVDILPDFIL